MANDANNLSTLNGFHKIVYGDLTDVLPEGVKLSKLIRFVSPSKKIGLEYRNTINIGTEHGKSSTYAVIC